MLSLIFNELLYRPLFNVLVFLYQTISFHDLGIAIVLLTIIIRLLLYPLSGKSLASQKEMMSIQPELRKIQDEFKNNKEEQMKRVMALYKEKKVNPLAGCLPILVQLPILIALYRVFLAGFNTEALSALYSFIPNPGAINHLFLGIIDISKQNLFLAVAAGALQFWQSKMILDKQKQQNTPSNFQTNLSLSMSKQMTYIMPIMTVVIAYSLHSGLALYWVTTTAFSILQQRRMFQKK